MDHFTAKALPLSSGRNVQQSLQIEILDLEANSVKSNHQHRSQLRDGNPHLLQLKNVI
jgi:hypothetical protein